MGRGVIPETFIQYSNSLVPCIMRYKLLNELVIGYILMLRNIMQSVQEAKEQNAFTLRHKPSRCFVSQQTRRLHFTISRGATRHSKTSRRLKVRFLIGAFMRLMWLEIKPTLKTGHKIVLEPISCMAGSKCAK